jgi:hypothetical protein
MLSLLARAVFVDRSWRGVDPRAEGAGGTAASKGPLAVVGV